MAIGSEFWWYARNTCYIAYMLYRRLYIMLYSRLSKLYWGGLKVWYSMLYNMLNSNLLYTIVYNMLYNMLAQAELPGACQEIQEWSCRVERFNPASSTPPGLCSRGRGSLHALATNAGYWGSQYRSNWSVARWVLKSGCKAIQKTSLEGFERAALGRAWAIGWALALWFQAVQELTRFQRTGLWC